MMRRYLAAVMDLSVTLLEIHKLMYFKQESGQGLRLKFTKGPYGPYAENLRHVLTLIEGHFIGGYGDAADKPDKPIEPKAEAVAAAGRFLADQTSQLTRCTISNAQTTKQTTTATRRQATLGRRAEIRNLRPAASPNIAKNGTRAMVSRNETASYRPASPAHRIVN